MSHHFGRKRRARRARGRRIEQRRPYLGGHIWLVGRQPGFRSDRSKCGTLLYDEIYSFPQMTEQQARDYMDYQRERFTDPTLGEPWSEEPGVVERLPEGMTVIHKTSAMGKSESFSSLSRWAARQGGPEFPCLQNICQEES